MRTLVLYPSKQERKAGCVAPRVYTANFRYAHESVRIKENTRREILNVGVALETVEVQHERANKPRQVRISPNVRRAIDLMVQDGLSRQAAAEKAGIQDNTLYIALRKPEVLAYRNECMRVIRTSEAARSVKRIGDLAESATSQTVKFESNKFLLATDPTDPIVPTQRTETAHRFPDGRPGLTIIMQTVHAAESNVPLIDGQSHEIELPSHLKHLPAPVPHPSRGTPSLCDATGESSGQKDGPRKRAGGQKSR